MSSANKTRGTRAETAIVRWLNDHGFPGCERRALCRYDRGDILGLPGFCIEVKDVARMSLAEWIDEAVGEAANCGPNVTPVVIRRRKGRPDPGEWFVVMRLSDFAELVR